MVRRVSRNLAARAVLAVVVAWLGGTASLPAQAWNDAGHMLAAMIAWDELSEPARAELARTLRAHPRFDADFAARMPRAIRAAERAEQDRWVFAHASTWPDAVRRFEHVRPAAARDALIAEYHRPRWHYINLFQFLSDEDGRALGPVEVNQSFDWTEADREEALNIVQALAMLTSEYGAPGTSDARRAIMLCWLLHLVGDIHQPLHTTALYASRAFPDGDRGGNNLVIDARDNLHSLWDRAAAQDRRWASLLNRLADFSAVSQPAWPERELTGYPARHFGEWAHEGNRLAAQYVYPQEILAQVEANNDAPRRALQIELPSGYRANMRTVAEVQILLAGWRTAWLLEQLSGTAHAAHDVGERRPPSATSAFAAVPWL
jgi:hypothetical protein